TLALTVLLRQVHRTVIGPKPAASSVRTPRRGAARQSIEAVVSHRMGSPVRPGAGAGDGARKSRPRLAIIGPTSFAGGTTFFGSSTASNLGRAHSITDSGRRCT